MWRSKPDRSVRLQQFSYQHRGVQGKSSPSYRREVTGMQQATNIERIIGGRAARSRPEGARRNLIETVEHFLSRKVNDRDRAEFCTQLAVMLQARVSLHRALEVLCRQASNRK